MLQESASEERACVGVGMAASRPAVCSLWSQALPRGDQRSALSEVLLFRADGGTQTWRSDKAHALVHPLVAVGQDSGWWGSPRAGGWQGSMAECATCPPKAERASGEVGSHHVRSQGLDVSDAVGRVLLSAEQAGVAVFAQA